MSQIILRFTVLYIQFLTTPMLCNAESFKWLSSCSFHIVLTQPEEDHKILRDFSGSARINVGTLEKLSEQNIPASQGTRYSRDTCTAFSVSIKEDQHRSLLQYLQSSVFLKENPTYAFIQMTNLHKRSTQVFLSCLRFIHVTSKFIIVTEHGYLLLCTHCKSAQLLSSSVLISSTVKQKTDETWLKLHYNLNGSVVHIFRPTLKQNNQPNCDELGDNFLGNPSVCIVEILSKFLSFNTIYISEEPVIVAADLFRDIQNGSGEVVDIDTVASLMLDNWQITNLIVKEYTKTETILQGWRYEPISFSLILDRRSISNSLTRSYDRSTWSLIIISITAISFLLTLSLTNHKFRNAQGHLPLRKWVRVGPPIFLQFLLFTLGALIEQNPNETRCKKSIASFRILFGTWLLTSLIISNGYTGTVISFLCSTTLPSNLPGDLNELKNQLKSYPLLSVDELVGSEIHIVEILLFEYFWKSSHLPNYKPYYKAILEEIYFLKKFTKSKLAFLYETQQLAIRTESLRNENANVTTPKWKIPNNFAFISREASTKRFSKLMKRSMGKNALVWGPVENHEIISVQAAFACTRNYFAVAIKRHVPILVEAGLSEMWKKNEEEYWRWWDWEEYGCWKAWAGNVLDAPFECFYENDSRVIHISRTTYAHDQTHRHSQRYGDHQSSTSTANNNNEPLGLDVLGSLFRILCYGGIAAIACLLGELLVTLWRMGRRSGEEVFMQAGVMGLSSTKWK